MEWKLFWILNTVGWDTIYSAEKEKKKKKDELSKLILFYSMCHRLNAPSFWPGCRRWVVFQPRSPSRAPNLWWFSPTAPPSSPWEQIGLAGLSWDLLKPLTTPCGQGLFTQVRPLWFPPKSIMRKNYPVEKKNTYSSQEIKGYFLIQFLLRENSDKLSTELEI